MCLPLARDQFCLSKAPPGGAPGYAASFVKSGHTITASGVFFAYDSLEGLLLIQRTLGDDRPGRWGGSFAVSPLDWQGSSLFVHRIGTGHIGGEA
jgi:hypothetical protein